MPIFDSIKIVMHVAIYMFIYIAFCSKQIYTSKMHRILTFQLCIVLFGGTVCMYVTCETHST